MTLLDSPPTPPEDASGSPSPKAALSLASVAATDHLVERAGWTAVCIALLAVGVMSWSYSLAFPGASVAQVAVVAAALGGAYRCWAAPGGPSRRLQGALMAVAVVAVGVIAAGQVLANPSYGTDSVAFGQYSARLVLHGMNPFVHSLAPSLARYHVPVIFTTHFLNGSTMTSASYPAGSFLFYLPALALGWHVQAAVVIDIAFWVAAMALMWRLLPTSANWVAPLILVNSIYLSYTIGGVTDTLYLPFLLLAVWRWDRYGASDGGVARWLGPVALGVAMAVKQTPWFFLPFLLVGVAFEGRSREGRWLATTARYLGVCVASFAVLNAPWIVASPRAWLRGSLAPLVSSFVPLGQGVINLTLVERLGGGDLSYYTLAGAAWVLLALAVTAVTYPRSKKLWPFLIVVSFFFTPRSLGNYFLMLVPAALLAAATAGDAAGVRALEWRWVRRAGAVTIAACTAAVAAGLVGAVATPSPLSIHVRSVSTNGQQQLVTDATVAVRNNTARVVSAAFALDNDGYLTNFWTPVSGGRRVTIAAHATRVVTLQAPDVASMPPAAAPFQLFGYTSAPAAVSSSQVYTSSTDTLFLTPTAVDSAVPVGTPLRFHVQLTDRLGRPVRKAGVAVNLGQIIYGEQGLLGGTASIDGHPEGASPVGAVTDAAGSATFTVRGVQSAASPDYFQAWITPSAGSGLPPGGYSQTVSVRFAPAGR